MFENKFLCLERFKELIPGSRQETYEKVFEYVEKFKGREKVNYIL